MLNGRVEGYRCESCHGTNPAHAKTPETARFPRVTRMTCITCHNKEVLGDEIPFDYSSVLHEVQCPEE